MGEIILKHGKVRKELQEIFKVSDRTVRDALKDRTKSKLAARIRKAAIIKGGVELVD